MNLTHSRGSVYWIGTHFQHPGPLYPTLVSADHLAAQLRHRVRQNLLSEKGESSRLGMGAEPREGWEHRQWVTSTSQNKMFYVSHSYRAYVHSLPWAEGPSKQPSLTWSPLPFPNPILPTVR